MISAPAARSRASPTIGQLTVAACCRSFHWVAKAFCGGAACDFVNSVKSQG